VLPQAVSIGSTFATASAVVSSFASVLVLCMGLGLGIWVVTFIIRLIGRADGPMVYSRMHGPTSKVDRASRGRITRGQARRRAVNGGKRTLNGPSAYGSRTIGKF